MSICLLVSFYLFLKVGFLIPWKSTGYLYCVCQTLVVSARNTIVIRIERLSLAHGTYHYTWTVCISDIAFGSISLVSIYVYANANLTSQDSSLSAPEYVRMWNVTYILWQNVHRPQLLFSTHLFKSSHDSSSRFSGQWDWYRMITWNWLLEQKVEYCTLSQICVNIEKEHYISITFRIILLPQEVGQDDVIIRNNNGEFGIYLEKEETRENEIKNHQGRKCRTSNEKKPVLSIPSAIQRLRY